MGRLAGKVAVVTGAASGIGAATAKIMAAEGAKVMAADTNIDGARIIAQEIAAAGGTATAVAFDALQADSIAALMDSAVKTYGALNIVHNNVGRTDITKDLSVVDMDLPTWDWVFEICLKSVLLGCKFAIPHMLKAGGGAIVNTASMAGAAGSLTNTAYNVSKAAVMALTENVAAQYGPQNIRCNCVAPGVILTPAVARAMPQPIVDIYQRYTLTTRLGQPEDIGHLVTFLASDDAGYINGQVIAADGGVRAHLPVTADMRNYKG